MRLTHLTLKNWRNFKQADFDLRDRMFVIGPNASGKSNLLDALRFLRQIASAGGGFQDAVASRSGMARVRCLAARNFNHGFVTIRIAVGDDDVPRRWTYEVAFTAEQRGRHRPILKREIVRRDDETVIARPTSADRDDPERMTQTHLEQVNANRGFRPISDFLRSIRYLHLVPHLIRDPERAGGRTDDPYGSDLLLRIARTPERTRAKRLQRISGALQAAVPQLDRLELVQDEIGRWHLEARYEHWRPQPAVQDERSFSDGTLRRHGGGACERRARRAAVAECGPRPGGDPVSENRTRRGRGTADSHRGRVIVGLPCGRRASPRRPGEPEAASGQRVPPFSALGHPSGDGPPAGQRPDGRPGTCDQNRRVRPAHLESRTSGHALGKPRPRDRGAPEAGRRGHLVLTGPLTAGAGRRAGALDRSAAARRPVRVVARPRSRFREPGSTTTCGGTPIRCTSSCRCRL